MSDESAENEAVCWINDDKGIISFHFVKGFKQKEFPSRQEMISYCYHATKSGYKLQ